MNRILYAILITITTLFTSPILCTAQFYQPTHFSGTQIVGGLNVTVTGVGTMPATTTAGLCSSVPIYSNGSSPAGTNNGYKFTFSGSVTRIRVHSYMLQYTDSLFFYINGNLYPVTATNLSVPTGICNGSTAPVMATHNGGITSSTIGPGCTPLAFFNAQIDISPATR